MFKVLQDAMQMQSDRSLNFMHANFSEIFQDCADYQEIGIENLLRVFIETWIVNIVFINIVMRQHIGYVKGLYDYGWLILLFRI